MSKETIIWILAHSIPNIKMIGCDFFIQHLTHSNFNLNTKAVDIKESLEHLDKEVNIPQVEFVWKR